MSALSELHREMASCRRCDLYKQACRTVPGEGNEHAEIMFIGEAPGFNEDQQGRPFVGQAGQFLCQLLSSINLTREQVFIANVIKHRPPSNRDPLPAEIIACRPWLEQQIELIKPRMIVTLGRYSMGMFFPGKTISKIHGTSYTKDDRIYFAMYHPAAALHQPSLKKDLEQDILNIPGILAKFTEPEEKAPQPQQLSMF
jgi:uracil-DNA glycosylase